MQNLDELIGKLKKAEIHFSTEKSSSVEYDEFSVFIDRVENLIVFSLQTDYILDSRVAGLPFNLYNNKGDLIGEYVTNRNGQFSIQRLDKGNYVLKFWN